MSVSLEFLGGPLDGQWQAFPEALWEHEVFFFEGHTIAQPPDDPDAPVPVTRRRYVRKRLPFMTRDVLQWEAEP